MHARAHSRYAHYDNSPSFSDFTAFGGWSTPAIKQYMGDKTSCGVGVDYNWYPDSFDEVREEAEKQQVEFGKATRGRSVSHESRRRARVVA